MAGYAGTPLPKKLGIKAGHKVCVLNAPGGFVRRLSSVDVRIAHDLRQPPDIVVLFVDRLADIERLVVDIPFRMHPAGGFWVVFPKSRRGCDVTEEVVRRIALAAGMVTNKVCTMGEMTGMRLVLRAEHRAAVSYRVEPPPVSRRVRRPTAAARVVRSGSGAGSAMHRARARSTK